MEVHPYLIQNLRRSRDIFIEMVLGRSAGISDLFRSSSQSLKDNKWISERDISTTLTIGEIVEDEALTNVYYTSRILIADLPLESKDCAITSLLTMGIIIEVNLSVAQESFLLFVCSDTYS